MSKKALTALAAASLALCAFASPQVRLKVAIPRDTP